MLKRVFHLFFICSFSQACWRFLGIHWNLASDFLKTTMQAKHQLRNPFFMEMFIIASQHIWKQRNKFILDKGRPSFISWKSSFYEEANLQAFRLCEEKWHAFCLWSVASRALLLVVWLSSFSPCFVCIVFFHFMKINKNLLQWGSPLLYFWVKKYTVLRSNLFNS